MKAAQDSDIHGVILEPFHKSFIVLGRENRGRHQETDLFAFQHALEGRAHGHFRFPVAHVAANKAVHGTRRFHVGDNIVDGPELIRGFLEGKSLLELAHFAVTFGKGKTLPGVAFGKGCRSSLASFSTLFLTLLLTVVQVLPPSLSRRALLAVQSHVFLDDLEVVDRDIEFVGVLVLNEQKIVGHAVDGELKQSLIFPDAVFDVHD